MLLLFGYLSHLSSSASSSSPANKAFHFAPWRLPTAGSNVAEQQSLATFSLFGNLINLSSRNKTKTKTERSVWSDWTVLQIALEDKGANQEEQEESVGGVVCVFWFFSQDEKREKNRK